MMNNSSNDDIELFREALLIRIPLYRQDINLFAKELFNFEPDDWQKETFQQFPKTKRMSIKSGQGVGKTAATAIIVMWFLLCFSYARIVATAPTRQQLYEVLWAEIAKWLNKNKMLADIIHWKATKVEMMGYKEVWFATAKAATKPENMQGYHADNMLFVVDEASGVADEIIETIQGTLSGQNNRLLMLGNPTKASGEFYLSHTKNRKLYTCLTVNSETCKRTNKENIKAIAAKYGKDSNVYRVRVLGEFPTQDDDVFIPLSWLEKSIMTDFDSKAKVMSIDIGCDVARFGDDKTAIGYKINNKCCYHKKYNGKDTMRTVHEIVTLIKKLKSKYRYNGFLPVKVDDGGVGGGVVDRLNEIVKEKPQDFLNVKIISIHFGMPVKHKYYYDTTTCMMAYIRDAICPVDDNGNPKPTELILPNDADLIAQLSCRKYNFYSSGSKQKVESKKDMKARGLPSPDEADCMLLCCWPIHNKTERKR